MALTKVTRTLLSTGIDDQSNATAITIDSSENVGIGTSSPARKVQIQDTSSTVYLSLVGPTNAGAGIMFGDSDDETVGRVTYDNSVNNMQFWTNDSEKMRIDSSGNVGIGTSSPLSKLDVAGNIRISDGVIEFDKPSVYGFRFLQNDAGNDLSIQQGDANNANYVTRLNIGSTGNVGIGTSSPARALEVHSSSSPVLESVASSTNNSSLRLRGSLSATHYWDVQHVHSDNDLSFGWSGGEKVRFTDTGNVGIGTTSPSAKLEVIHGNVSQGNGVSFGRTASQSWDFWGDSGANVLYSKGNFAIIGTSDSQDLSFRTNNTDRMRLDASGDVVIGHTAAVGTTHKGKLQVKSAISILDGSNTTAATLSLYSSGANSAFLSVDPDQEGNDTHLYFYIDAAHKMKLDNNGRLSIDSLETRTASGALNLLGTVGTSDSGGNYQAIAFRHNASTVVGTVTTTASATSYNTSSDYRLKENVDYTWDATTRLKQLKPARFNFITDDTNTLVDGFLAHEVSSIVPEAITGEKDAMMDEKYEITPAVKGADGGVVTEAVMGTHSVPNYQSIDQAKLVPLLVKTIQELEARITTLEG